MARQKMHQTTVRFPSALWEELAVQADKQGISVAQYVRDTAVARLAQEGEPSSDTPGAPSSRAREASADAQNGARESEAVWAQARHARRRSRALKEEAAARRSGGKSR